MVATTTSALRRVISASDDMEVLSASSPPEDSHPIHRDTNNPAFPSPMRSTRFNSGENTPLEGTGLFLAPRNESSRCHSSFAAQAASLFPQIMAPLHRSSHAIGFNSLSADVALFRNNIDEKHEDYDSDSKMSDQSSCENQNNSNRNRNRNRNRNHHNLFDNPLLSNLISSQRSLQSQPSNVSIHSAQSWGQIAVIDLPPQVNDMEAPTYVLEESPSSQNLWRQTAGNRPPQPVEERAFFERMWAENFARSEVHYGVSVEDLVRNGTTVDTSPMIVEEDDGSERLYSSIYSIGPPGHRPSRKEDVAEAILLSRMNDSSGIDSASPPSPPQKTSKTLDKDTTLLWKGLNTFGTTVSKSFAQTAADGLISVTTVNISIASYRVVESKRHGRYAQFHVIYREGNMRDTIGVWKRYRDFENLANKITDTCEGCSMLHGSHHIIEPEVEQLPNAVTSWRLMKKRKRWYRCLDAGYLSLKVFLLERFLHDVLFESSSPQLLRDFVMSSVLEDMQSPSLPNSP